MSNHTPGPWTVDATDVCRVVDFQDCTICRSDCIPLVDLLDEAEWHLGNAQLIAAAPDLLAALEECITQEGATARKDSDPHKLIRRLNAIDSICRVAIEQATGKEVTS